MWPPGGRATTWGRPYAIPIGGESMNPERRLAIAEVAVGLGVAALGAFMAFETSQFQVSPLYAKVGPQLIPYLIAGGLILLGLVFAAAAARSRTAAPPSSGAASEP